jgi:hypothetical protein
MIADLPECEDGDFWCKAAFGLLKRNLWSPYVRNNLVQAQYYRVYSTSWSVRLNGGLESRGFGTIFGVVGMVG